MPQATSTIWMARRTSSLASEAVLPFSRVRTLAKSAVCLSSHRDFAPLEEGVVRGADGPVDIALVGVGHFSQQGSGGGVDDRAADAADRPFPIAVDVKRDQ
jgi:hypothetical protein